MRIVVTGATGNLGTSVVARLLADPAVDSVVGLARRLPTWPVPEVEWRAADVRAADLARIVEGADAVVHLAWAFGPTHRPAVTWDVNVAGTARLLDAVASTGVPGLVVASSVGAYSPSTSGTPVEESWPTHGWSPAAYCLEKAYVERMLDAFEVAHPAVALARMRPAFLFKAPAALEQARIFAGRLAPVRLIGKAGLPLSPAIPGLRFQAMHTDDAADAFALAATTAATGPFNLAAGPVVDSAVIAGIFGGRRVRIPASLVRGMLAAAWRARAVPTDPNLFDYLMKVPLLDSGRARRELGWRPQWSSVEALRELRHGLAQGRGFPTPPLQPQPALVGERSDRAEE